MKHVLISGASVKEPNGAGDSLAKGFPGRRFHDDTVYIVRYEGAHLDNSTVRGITRSPAGWDWKPAQRRSSYSQ